MLVDGVAVRGCCLLAVQVDGCEVETVESLRRRGPLTALQEAFRRHHALQCGFCTPGILMAATDLLARGDAHARGDRRPALGPPLPLHRLCADRRRDRGLRYVDASGSDVNLARSLLAACERHPELEAFPGLTYGELLPRVRAAGGRPRTSRRATGSQSYSTTASRRRSSTGPRSGAGAVLVPLSWRLSEEELGYCVVDCGARVVLRDGDELPDGAEHPGALDRDERETSLLLYTSGTTGRPKGVPRSHAADRAGRLVAGAPARLRFGDRTLGVMPLYHTMGIHSLARDAPRRRLLRAAGALGRRRGAAADRGRADHVAVPRADALPRPRPPPGRAARDVSSVRALGYAGAAMTSTLVRRCAEVFEPEVFVNHYGSTEIYTFTIGRDQLGQAGLRRAGRRVNTRLRLGRGAARSASTSSLGRGVRRLLEPARRRCEGDP